MSENDTAGTREPAGTAVRAKKHISRKPITVARVISDVLLTGAVFIALFLVWQLWWTDVVAWQHQAAIMEDLGWPTVSEEIATPETGDPPVLPEFPEGEVWGTFHVPRWGADNATPLAAGVDRVRILDALGVGHYPGTAMPGEVGNFSVAAHRTTFGRPFHFIHELEVGDPVIVRTEEYWYVYRVTHWEIVYPWQVEVVSPIPGYAPGEDMPEPTERLGSMTSCHPMYSARQRWITFLEFDYWARAADGIPREMAEGQGATP
ncbi:MAG: class E sortase [Cellulomonadaceae bacterium]|jgi:sortase A|nr:class E sortase [Cellulomonadaceae bacterium]